VAHFGPDPERIEQAPPADAEYELLIKTQFRPAPYSSLVMLGEPGGSQVIAVEQVKLYSANLGLPGAQPDRITGQVELQPQPLPVRLAQRRDGQLPRIVVGEKGLLSPVLVEHLAEIALLEKQPYSTTGTPRSLAALS